jgi:hypothetical protein
MLTILVKLIDEYSAFQRGRRNIAPDRGDPASLVSLPRRGVAYEPIEPIDLANMCQNGARSARWPQAQLVECRFDPHTEGVVGLSSGTRVLARKAGSVAIATPLAHSFFRTHREPTGCGKKRAT